MKRIITEIGEIMANKMALVNIERKHPTYKDNIREYPIYSELYGMMQTLKAMDIDYDIEWNMEIDQMTSLTIMGIKFKVKWVA